MSIRCAVFGALAGALATHALPGQSSAKAPPTPDSLAAITERGRSLAQYDAAAWVASDSVMARRPPAGAVTRYVARRVESGWVVAFGRLSARGDTFYVAFEVHQDRDDPDAWTVAALSPARADTGFCVRAARAIDLAKADFGRAARPYNVAVLPRREGGLWVYMMPAQTRADVWPLGADVRYQVTEDGRRVVGKRQLHNSLLERGPGPTPGGERLEAGYHTAVLDDIPEDTDVFHVLVRRPAVPEYVVTDAFVYSIATDGQIRLHGRREDVLGK